MRGYFITSRYATLVRPMSALYQKQTLTASFDYLVGGGE
jgi:hypothetical protein